MKKLIAVIIAVLLCAMGAVTVTAQQGAEIAVIDLPPGLTSVGLLPGSSIRLRVLNPEEGMFWTNENPDVVTFEQSDDDIVITAQAPSGRAYIAAYNADGEREIAGVSVTIIAEIIELQPGINDITIEYGHAYQLRLPAYDGSFIGWASNNNWNEVSVDSTSGIIAALVQSGTAVIEGHNRLEQQLVATVNVTIVPSTDPPSPDYRAAYRAEVDAILNAFYAWIDVLEAALTEEELGELESKFNAIEGDLDINIERAEQAKDWDAALRACKEYFAAHILVLEDNSQSIKAPQSLWDMLDSGEDEEQAEESWVDALPEWLSFIGDLPEWAQTAIYYLFFFWLWM